MGIREEWRKRVSELLVALTLRQDEDMAKVINEHLEQWALLPELALREFANDPEHPERRLVVVDTEDTTEVNVWNESITVLTPATFYRVVKMEDK